MNINADIQNPLLPIMPPCRICPGCGGPLYGARKSCSSACRQRIYRRNKARNVTPLQSDPIQAIEAKLDAILLQMRQGLAVPGTAPIIRPGADPLTLPELEIKHGSGDGGKRARENFFRSMAMIQGLDPSAFGIGKSPSAGNAKPIKGANVELAAPDFNDLPEL